MEITSSHKGQTIKTANVRFPEGISDTDVFADHERAARFAMEFFGETPERLMDWDTDRYDSDDTIVVRLYTA